ncbi:hypothetical protein [Paenibacillus validus]|uniref:hypothetical protein n=1 Tax=Paenibacillus validus TaxID=44253 RepID=UPI003D2C1533
MQQHETLKVGERLGEIAESRVGGEQLLAQRFDAVSFYFFPFRGRNGDADLQQVRVFRQDDITVDRR